MFMVIIIFGIFGEMEMNYFWFIFGSVDKVCEKS